VHLDGWLAGAELGQHVREVDQAHAVGLHRPEPDRARTPPRTASTASRAAVAAWSIARACGRRALPASVSSTLCVERSNSLASVGRCSRPESRSCGTFPTAPGSTST
jgi:hypothetical protein